MTEVVEGVSKLCKRCGEVKPLDAFSPDAANKDGRHGYCKACRSIMNSRTQTSAAGVLRRAREAAVAELVTRHQEEFDGLLGAALRVECSGAA